MNRKKMYSKDEALDEVLDKIKPSNFDDFKDYDKFRMYRQRHEKGKLGQKAIDTLLSFFGFKKHVHYTKERQEPTN